MKLAEDPAFQELVRADLAAHPWSTTQEVASRLGSYHAAVWPVILALDLETRMRPVGHRSRARPSCEYALAEVAEVEAVIDHALATATTLPLDPLIDDELAPGRFAHIESLEQLADHFGDSEATGLLAGSPSSPPPQEPAPPPQKPARARSKPKPPKAVPAEPEPEPEPAGPEPVIFLGFPPPPATLRSMLRFARAKYNHASRASRFAARGSPEATASLRSAEHWRKVCASLERDLEAAAK